MIPRKIARLGVTYKHWCMPCDLALTPQLLHDSLSQWRKHQCHHQTSCNHQFHKDSCRGPGHYVVAPPALAEVLGVVNGVQDHVANAAAAVQAT